jgi:hypothetical protein
LNSHNNGLEQKTNIRIQIGTGLSLPLPFVLFQHLENIKNLLYILSKAQGRGYSSTGIGEK